MKHEQFTKKMINGAMGCDGTCAFLDYQKNHSKSQVEGNPKFHHKIQQP
jgi:hypothetical protein